MAVVLALVVLAPSSADAARFENRGPITIPGAGTATPYPSTIEVSGLIGTITDLDVAVERLSFPFADDLGIVVQGPHGQALTLLQGGPGEALATTITFDDSAAIQPTQGVDLDGFGSYTFKPTAYYADDDYPAPGPGTSYGNPGPAEGGTATLASTFSGTDPNGTWRLFVVNFAALGDTGQIINGWRLRIRGFVNFTLGKPRISKGGKSATIPAAFPGPGRAVLDDPGPPSIKGLHRSTKKRRPQELVVPQPNMFLSAATTLDLPVIPTPRARRILARKGKVRLPVRVIFGNNDGDETRQTVAVTLKRRKKQ